MTANETYVQIPNLERGANTDRSPYLNDGGYTAESSGEEEEQEEDESEGEDGNQEQEGSEDEAHHKNK